MSTQTPTQQSTTQTVSPIAPIDPTIIVEHGESPTAIILAVTILLTFLFSSLTGLIRVILLHQTKPK
jgi:hypothetical protein